MVVLFGPVFSRQIPLLAFFDQSPSLGTLALENAPRRLRSMDSLSKLEVSLRKSSLLLATSRHQYKQIRTNLFGCNGVAVSGVLERRMPAASPTSGKPCQGPGHHASVEMPLCLCVEQWAHTHTEWKV
eukprot:scaffold48_cov394-Pavlova_lutheri.AAC.12